MIEAPGPVNASAKMVSKPIEQADAQTSFGMQVEVLKILQMMRPSDAIGACVSYLQYLAQTKPDVVRRVLNEKVIRQGFTGISMMDLLRRISK